MRLHHDAPLASDRVARETAGMAIDDIRELGTILSVWAHPDDEAYLCGGIMAMATAAGSRVVCVTATRGELGVTDAERWPPDRLPAIREAELAECLRVLGVREHRWLGYPDGGCAGVDRGEGAERIAQLLRDVSPDTVLTFAPDGQTGHPDHIAVHHWTADAVRATGIGTLHVVANTQEWMDEFLTGMLELNVLMGEPPATWTAPVSIDLPLTEEVIGRKLSALAAQASQTEALRAAVGDDFYRRLIGIERFGRYPG
jgi:LmbE family N-acetylglucosaminyl deacetylase